MHHHHCLKPIFVPCLKTYASHLSGGERKTRQNCSQNRMMARADDFFISISFHQHFIFCVLSIAPIYIYTSLAVYLDAMVWLDHLITSDLRDF
jgi:hypothetical protein